MMLKKVFKGLEKDDPEFHYPLHVKVKHMNPVDGDSENPSDEYAIVILKYDKERGYEEVCCEGKGKKRELDSLCRNKVEKHKSDTLPKAWWNTPGPLGPQEPAEIRRYEYRRGKYRKVDVWKIR